MPRDQGECVLIRLDSFGVEHLAEPVPYSSQADATEVETL
jgi:hypothetical protein